MCVKYIKCLYCNRLVMDWSIKLGQVLEQEVLRKGKPNKLGFGSYKADNTELIRPYQQESSSPIGRGYPMSVVSGAPTVFDPRAGIQEDPIVMLLKKLLGEKPVVQKAPDAGFKSNEQVYPTSGQALEAPGRTLGAKPASLAGSTDYGSLNQFKSELANLSSATESFKTADSSSLNVNTTINYSGLSSGQKSFEDAWADWVTDLQDALDGADYEGLEKNVATNGLDKRALDIIQTLDDILLETRVLNLDSDSAMGRRFKSSNVYYAGLAALTGEYTFGQAFDMLTKTDNLRLDRQRIIDAVKERGIEVAESALAGNITSSGSSLGIDDAAEYAKYRKSSSGSFGGSLPSPLPSSGSFGGSLPSPLPGMQPGATATRPLTIVQPSSSSGSSVGKFRFGSSKSGSSKSGSIFVPSNDGRKERGRRTSPVNTRSKKKKVVNPK